MKDYIFKTKIDKILTKKNKKFIPIETYANSLYYIQINITDIDANRPVPTFIHLDQSYLVGPPKKANAKLCKFIEKITY